MRTRSTRGCARSRPNSTREICSTARRTSRRGEPERGVLGEHVPAAGLAPFAVAHRGLVVGADVIRAARDPHVLRVPQGEGVDRAGGPTPARAAMAITHAGRLARHGELDGAAEAAALIGLRIAHEDTGCSHWLTRRTEHAPRRRSAQARLSVSKRSTPTHGAEAACSTAGSAASEIEASHAGGTARPPD